MLMVIFLISIAVLLFCIIKLKLNAFVALLVTAYGTGIACMMPLADVSDVVTNKFGSTLGGIGIVELIKNFGLSKINIVPIFYTEPIYIKVAA